MAQQGTEQHHKPGWEQRRRVPAGFLCCAAQLHHGAATKVKAPTALLHFPAGDLQTAGHKGAQLGDCIVPNHDSVQQSPDATIHRGKAPVLFQSLTDHWLCEAALLHLPDAYGCLKKIKNEKLCLKQCPNLVHHTQGCLH